MQASLSDNVDLDGRVATGVVDLAGVDLSDGHVCGWFLVGDSEMVVSRDTWDRGVVLLLVLVEGGRRVSG